MIIGVPKEVKDHESRVGVTPAGAKALVEAGHKVLVEHNAGALSAISISAIWPRAVAPIIYQAGAMALPVTWISQVITSCVVPPKAPTTSCR